MCVCVCVRACVCVCVRVGGPQYVNLQKIVFDPSKKDDFDIQLQHNSHSIQMHFRVVFYVLYLKLISNPFANILSVMDIDYNSS